MAGVHVANQCKLVFSEYGWPDTLISDNAACYKSQVFTSVMQAFSVNVQIVMFLFNKAKDEGKDI